MHSNVDKNNLSDTEIKRIESETLMTEKYPNLSWILDDVNESKKGMNLKNELFDKYKDKPRYLLKLETLIRSLRSSGCKGLQKKLNHGSDLDRFGTFISELEIAKILIDNKKGIELLSDRVSHPQKIKSPDIICKDEIFTTYIEVTGIRESPYVMKLILEQLREFAQCCPYRIDVFLKKELSIPKMEHDERHVQEALVTNSLDLLKKSFHEATKTHAFPEKQIEIDTKYIIFTLEKTELKTGYPGIIKWECIEIPTDKLKEYIIDRLIERAKKRDSFEDEHKNCPYIIAIDCSESSIDVSDINNLLYGKSCPLGSNSSRSIIETKNCASRIKVEKARNKGWESFLIKKFLLPNNNVHISEDGIFVTLEEMKNVSALLFRDNWGEVSFHPNPFCSDEINDLRIINFMKTIE